jgi:hypothetical protein
MAANPNPIYSRVGAVGVNGAATLGTAIVSDYNGTGANNAIVFTADATNGGFVQRIRLKALGTNAIAVLRVYINNGSVNTTAANNSFYGEISLPATTASTTTATVDIDYPLNFALPPGYRLVCGISAAANLATGWAVTTIAGAY